MKDEFLAVVSHELRTPLNAINGWSYMLLGRHDGRGRQARALQSIQRQVRSQCQLIDDLLDVARIVSGKLRLELQEVEPSKVIAAALDVVRPAAEAKQIDLVADARPRRGDGVGRPGTTAAGDLEPAVQCDQVHAGGRSC